MEPKWEGHEVFITNLRRLMHDQRISQATLSERSGIQRSHVSNILNGADIRISTLAHLAKALGVEPGALLMAEQAPKPAPSDAESHRKAIMEAIGVLLEKARE